MRLARGLLLAAIRGYKRHWSPHKGFACACRVHEGRASCSSLGLRAISRYGAWRGLGVLRLRLAECGRVAAEHRSRRTPPALAQAGFIDCDLPCDASCLDASACDACSLGDAFDVVACVDCSDLDACGCPDWGWPAKPAGRRRRRRGEPASTAAA